MGFGKTISTLIRLTGLCMITLILKEYYSFHPKKVAESTWAKKRKNGVLQDV